MPPATLAAAVSLLDPNVLVATLALVGALLVGAAVIWAADKWRRKPTNPAISLPEQLAEFRSSYEQGELSQEEYERIRAKLAPKLKRDTLPTAPPAPPKIAPKSPPAPDS